MWESHFIKTDMHKHMHGRIENVYWNIVIDFDFEIPGEDSLSSIFKEINCYKIRVKGSIQLFYEQ